MKYMDEGFILNCRFCLRNTKQFLGEISGFQFKIIEVYCSECGRSDFYPREYFLIQNNKKTNLR